jgi:ABC-type Zn uptake system ZnuABC Zn-binding protein ZnuA
MRETVVLIVLTLIFGSGCPRANKESRFIEIDSRPLVITTLPDLADWVRQVGGESVAVQSLIVGTEEPHNYEPRVADVDKIKKAVMVVRIGLGLDEWLNGLIENARNERLKIVTVSEGVEIIQDEDVAEHKENHHHVHDYGNPHIWLDPNVARLTVQRIVDVLSEFNPARKDFYQKRGDDYIKRIDSTVAELRRQVENLPARKFVAMHESWPYFCRAFGFEMVRAIEPLPGQEPSAKDLAHLVQMIRQEDVRAIVVEPQHNRDVADAIARETGVKVVVLASITGSLPSVTDYLTLLEYDVKTLARALSGGG